MPVEINGKIYFRTLEVCRKTGISRATLFRWLKEGIVEAPNRDRRGWKLFGENDINKITMEANRVHTGERRTEARG